MFKYSMNIVWSEEDACYVATIPEFPGLSAFGETPEEASAQAKTAAVGFIEILNEDGEAIPEPRELSSFSGQTRLRMPKDLHNQLTQQAEQNGVSLNTYIVSLLAGNSSAEKVYYETLREVSKLKKELTDALSHTVNLQSYYETIISLPDVSPETEQATVKLVGQQTESNFTEYFN